MRCARVGGHRRAEQRVDARRPQRRPCAGGRGAAYRSIRPGRTVPAPILCSRCAMRAVASGGALGVGAALEAVRGLGVHAERLGRAPDRERVPVRGLERHRRACRRETSLEAPPMIPASASGPSGPATTPMRGVRARALDAVERRQLSPSRAQRTTSRAPGMRARSNACEGWPISSIT